MNAPINIDSLRQLLASSSPPTLIHLLPDEDFAEAHLPGARCFCVYESAFVSKIDEAFPDKAVPLVVYGRSDATFEAGAAVTKLHKAGYTNVTQLSGGLKAWRDAGGIVEGSGVREEAPLNGTYALDTARSAIYWTGRNLFNHHHGTVSPASGVVKVIGGQLASAKFTIDMQSLTCADLVEPALNAALIAHLKSDDFFAVHEHPTAEFKATAVTPIPACTDGSANQVIQGLFTLRGVAQPLEFPALIAKAPDGSLTAQAEFDLDRTRWGAIYGSGKFFARLMHHVVNDLVHLHLKLRFEPCN